MNVVGWKLYYADGSVFSSRQGEWREAPVDGVQALSVYYDRDYPEMTEAGQVRHPYRDMFFGKDYYWQFGNGQAYEVPEGADIKRGLEIDQQDFRRIYGAAFLDLDF